MFQESRVEKIITYPETSKKIVSYSDEPERNMLASLIEKNPSRSEKDVAYALYCAEMMVLSPDELESDSIHIPQERFSGIEKELGEIFHFSLPRHMLSELMPIHKHFQYLIKSGKALLEDEVAYIEGRYGWGPVKDTWRHWDDALAKVSLLWRSRVVGLLSQGEFEQMVQSF